MRTERLVQKDGSILEKHGGMAVLPPGSGDYGPKDRLVKYYGHPVHVSEMQFGVSWLAHIQRITQTDAEIFETNIAAAIALAVDLREENEIALSADNTALKWELQRLRIALARRG